MLYLFKVENPSQENIEMIISAEDKDIAISLLCKELNHTADSLAKKGEAEFNYISERFKDEKDYFIRRPTEKYFCIGEFSFSYNDYISDTIAFKETFLKEYYNYYYQPYNSLEYNLDNHLFEVINLSEEELNNKNKVLNKTKIYCGR